LPNFDDLSVSIGADDEKVEVAGDDEVGASQVRAFEDHVVVRVAADAVEIANLGDVSRTYQVLG
jgi:hypothetical protein